MVLCDDIMRYRAAVCLQVCPTPKLEFPFLAILIHRVLMCSLNFRNPFLFTLFLWAAGSCARMEGRRQLAGVSFQLPPGRCPGRNSDCQAWCLHLLSHFTGPYFILFPKVCVVAGYGIQCLTHMKQAFCHIRSS